MEIGTSSYKEGNEMMKFFVVVCSVGEIIVTHVIMRRPIKLLRNDSHFYSLRNAQMSLHVAETCRNVQTKTAGYSSLQHNMPHA